jgi:hypothetical protein
VADKQTAIPGTADVELESVAALFQGKIERRKTIFSDVRIGNTRPTMTEQQGTRGRRICHLVEIEIA